MLCISTTRFFWGSSSPRVTVWETSVGVRSEIALAVRAEHFDRLSTGLSKYERPSDIRHHFRAPFDRLRANGSALWGSSSPAVHPSTGSGRTEAHFGDRLPRLFTLRQAQGERKRILGIVFPGCAPFDRLRANGSALRQAQGERKRILGIVFPGSSPFDRLRANGSALWGSSSLAVHPSTGSGRTDYAVNGKAHTLSVASLESPLRHCAEAPCGIAREGPLRHRAEALCGIA